MSQAGREGAKARDAALRAHLETHDVLDWLRTVRRLEQELYNAGPTGVRPHAMAGDRLRAEMLLDAPREDVRADGRLAGRVMLMWPGHPVAVAADSMEHRDPCEWPKLRCCCPPPEES